MSNNLRSNLSGVSLTKTKELVVIDVEDKKGSKKRTVCNRANDHRDRWQLTSVMKAFLAAASEIEREKEEGQR